MKIALAFGAMTLFAISITTTGHEPNVVATDGKQSKVILEHPVAGHLEELNGKYKLRVAEVTYVPGGYIGPHHHAGPGIRCITAGELTYVRPDTKIVYQVGDCFFESGDTSHTAKNNGETPVVLLNFVLLPSDWTGGSAFPEPH